MVSDLVLDVDVLAHAENPGNAWFAHAVKFVDEFGRSEVVLCVDLGFRLDDRNRSLIGQEYRATLAMTPGTVTAALFVALLRDGRVSEVPRRVSAATRRAINKAVTDARDRKYVEVASNTTSHLLVSHDDRAYSSDEWSEFGWLTGVDVVDCIGGYARVCP